MTVRPTPSGQTPRPAIARSGKSDATTAPRRPNEAPLPPTRTNGGDDVQISTEARDLQALGATQGGAPALAPDRLRQVLQRMSDGHYDRPEVQSEVVRRIAKEL